MNNVAEILKKSVLFHDIEENDISSMLNCLSAYKKSFEKGSYVLTQESQINEVGIVLSGSVNIIKEDFWGNCAIISKAKPGEMFGEAFACSGIDKLPVSVTSSEKSEILFINYKKIITTCKNTCVFHSHLIDNMIKILSHKNIMLTQKIEHLMKPTTREKLLSYLSAQAIDRDSNSFDIPFSRQELADYLSVDRSALSKEICRLRDENILEFNKNHFVLK